MKLKRYHYIAIIVSIAVIILNFILFFGKSMFFFIFGIAILVSAFPFIFDFIYRLGKEKEREEMFLEFISDLTESVKVGTPISKSILNISKRDYKSLDRHIKKLANQITIGIPLSKALEIFAKDTKSKIIARAIELISQAEKAGGKIENILEAAVTNVREIEEIRKKRSASIHNMVMQGYVIFFIFLIIMVFIQAKFIPSVLETIGSFGQAGYELGIGLGGAGSMGVDVEFLNTIVLILIMVQGFFAGLVISKLSEGKLFPGIKHSFILMAISFLILQGARVFIT